MSPDQEDPVSPEELEQLALSTPRATAADDDGTGIEVCACCLKEVGYLDALCPHCGAPVSGMAGLLIFESTLATGYIYRRAVANPGKPLVLIFMWLQFSPGLVCCALLLGDSLRNGGYFRADACLNMMFTMVVNAAVLFQTTRNYFRRTP